eukprot:767739-Hanusia_phi.AAC.1
MIEKLSTKSSLKHVACGGADFLSESRMALLPELQFCTFALTPLPIHSTCSLQRQSESLSPCRLGEYHRSDQARIVKIDPTAAGICVTACLFLSPKAGNIGLSVIRTR